MQLQKVLGQNYTLAQVPWKVLGRMSPLPLWSRRLWFVHRFNEA